MNWYVVTLMSNKAIRRRSFNKYIYITCTVAFLTRSRWPYIDMRTIVRYCSSRMTSFPFALSTFILVYTQNFLVQRQSKYITTCNTYRYCMQHMLKRWSIQGPSNSTFSLSFINSSSWLNAVIDWVVSVLNICAITALTA